MGSAQAAEWKVSPYDPIRVLDENLWVVQADIPGMALQLRRTMTVCRMMDGGLAIHSAIALEDKDMARLEAFGRLAILVVPNGFHRIDAPRYKARYPDMKVYCPSKAAKQVGERVAVDGHYDRFPQDASLRVECLEGGKVDEAVLISTAPSGAVTLIFNDFFFNVPHLPGFAGTIYRWLGQSGQAMVPLISRLMLMNDKKALRAHLERLAALPGLKRIVPGHGLIIETDAANVLKNAAALLG